MVSFGSCSSRSKQIDPLFQFRRAHGGVHHLLCRCAIVEIRRARTLMANGINKFPRLIVTKRDERIALRRVTWRARDFPKLARDFDGLQSGAARVAGLQRVPGAGSENVRPFAAV